MEKNLPNDYYFYLVSSNNPVFVFVGRININQVDFCGLKVGQKVNRVGDSDRSGQASLNRMQHFKTFVTYAGTFNEKIYTDGETADMLLFELQESDRPIGINETCYIGYIIIQHDEHIELRVPDLKHNNPVYILRPKFGILEV